MKIADIYSEKLSEGSEPCPENPQGTCPLTHFRALPEPVLAGRQEKGADAPFVLNRIIREPYVNRLSRHILTTWRRFRYSTILLTTAPPWCGSAVFLHIQDGLLAEEDEKLPLAGHVVGTLQHFHFIKDFVFIVFVWTQKIVVSDPERQVIVSPVDVVKAVCMTVRSLIGAVEPFDHLFKRTVFR